MQLSCLCIFPSFFFLAFLRLKLVRYSMRMEGENLQTAYIYCRFLSAYVGVRKSPGGAGRNATFLSVYFSFFFSFWHFCVLSCCDTACAWREKIAPQATWDIDRSIIWNTDRLVLRFFFPSRGDLVFFQSGYCGMLEFWPFSVFWPDGGMWGRGRYGLAWLLSGAFFPPSIKGHFFLYNLVCRNLRSSRELLLPFFSPRSAGNSAKQGHL